MRRYFADLLAVLSNRYQLCPTARHLAVYLLDLFMDHYDVAVRQLYVIALSCLLLASKSTPRLNIQRRLHECAINSASKGKVEIACIIRGIDLKSRIFNPLLRFPSDIVNNDVLNRTL